MNPDASCIPLLEVTGLNVVFGARSVVSGFDLTLGPGERVAIVGESGSGKTLTALALMGLATDARVTGERRLNGRSLSELTEAEWGRVRGREMAMVFQEPMTALNPVQRVGHQVAEVFRLHQGMDTAQAEAATLSLFQDVDLPDPSEKFRAYPHQLSGGQRQRVLVAMSLAGRPRLLWADEPTTALDASLRGHILALIEAQQTATGMALVLISHDLQLVRRHCDRVCVMQHGRLVEQGPIESVFANPQHPYTRQLLDSVPQRAVRPRSSESATGAPVLSGQQVSVTFSTPKSGIRGWWQRVHAQVLKPLDFHVHPGECLAVVGESGSGKTTLALAALELLAHEGEVRVHQQPWARSLRKSRPQRRRVQVVFQDPFSALSPRMTVFEILTEGLRVHEPLLTAEQQLARVCEVLSDVGLLGQPGEATSVDPSQPGSSAAELLRRYPHQFSGGQRQRLAIARALVIRPDMLVLDEPTSALDVSVQRQVLALLQRLQAEKNLAYLLITHDMAVVRAMAHRVLVLNRGTVVEEGDVDTVFHSPREPYTRTLLQAAGVG